MKYSKLFLVGAILCAFMAVNAASMSSVNSEDFSSNPLVKLGRGVANVAFGPLEILIRPYDVNHQQGGIAALTYGVFSGIFHVIAREVIGVVEIVTFLIPLPGCSDDPFDTTSWGYGPILYPEWVIDTEHNAFNVFYPKDAIVAP